MKPRELVALLWGGEAGRVRQDRDGRLSWTYDEAWRRRDGAVPLSLSLPLAAAEHGHAPVEAYLGGLLPDNEQVLERWAQRFQVSPRNPFALLAHVGEDCAGAVQFALPERVGLLQDEGPPKVEWLTQAGVAARLRALREDEAAWRTARDSGQFSLAGSQRKTALLLVGGRWGVPAGRTPTTHILKPPIPRFDGHVENEHLCLRLARAVGLPAAASEVRRFGTEFAIVVARYDRVRTRDVAAATADTKSPRAAKGARALRALARTEPVLRLHQEDVCQALGVRPLRKYQSEGGPSPADVVDLLREHSARRDEDVSTFVDSMIFNRVIGGTDAHAKNVSVLHESGGRVRLAPLYDVASVLPSPDVDPRRARLAMKVGSEYRLQAVGRRHWVELASELRLDASATVARARELAARIRDGVAEVRESLTEEGLDHPIVARLGEIVRVRAEACLRKLA